MLLNFNMNANITVDVANESIKELQDLFNRVKSTPETHRAYEMLCESLKDGIEYGSEEHIYQYLQWVLERDLNSSLKDDIADIAYDFTLFLNNKCLYIDLQEFTINQVVIGTCKQIEDKQLCLNI